MTVTWKDEKEPEPTAIGLLGWIRVVTRGGPLAVLVFGGLLVLLLIRLIERPIFGENRPVTPHLTRFVCRNAFRILGISLVAQGKLMKQPGAVVANHSSWLDIFALNARKRVYFVSKAEVANWPGIGWLARATGTVFIERDRRKAMEHTRVFESRLLSGHKLLFFPEGTSTDGRRVLPFKTTLFEAFFTPALRDVLYIQPVTVIYSAPQGYPSNFYGWWGNMDFAPHFLGVLAGRRGGVVQLIYHIPLKVSEAPDRKMLALSAENAVRHGFDTQSALGAETGPALD